MSKIDNTLIELCKKGNQTAQMQVYDAYSQAMFTIACRYLNNDEDAKDAMQDGFLKAFINIAAFKPEATFGAWLKRIIINQCLDVLKKKKLQFENVELSELRIIDDINWNFDRTISKTEILKAIAQLTEKHKIVVQLYVIEGYDHQEISQILDILKQNYNAARY